MVLGMVVDILFHQLTLFFNWYRDLVVQNLHKGGTVMGQTKDLPTHTPARTYNAAVRVIHHIARRRSISKLVDSGRCEGGTYVNPGVPPETSIYRDRHCRNQCN